MKQSYFTFPTTFQAIKAEKALTGGEWDFKMVPVPRSISSSCGVALRCRPEDAGTISVFLRKTLVETDGCFELEDDASSRAWSFFKKKGNDN